MFSWLLGPTRSLVTVLLANDSSVQIAGGVAMGVVLGMCPAGSLTAMAMTALLCAVRVNKTAGLVTAAAMAFAAPLADPFTHKLGLKVLTLPSLQPTFAWLYDQPTGPWWGLHNTVACGSLLVGLYLTYPVFLVTRGVVDRVRPKAVAWIMRYKLGRVLLGAQVSHRVGAAFGVGA